MRESDCKHLTLVDVRKHTALGDGDLAEKLVQLFIVADGKLKVTRNDTSLLVVTCSISSQLENLSSKIFQDSGEINGCTWSQGQKTKARRRQDFKDVPAPTRWA